MSNVAICIFLIIVGCGVAKAEGASVTSVQLQHRLASLEDRINDTLVNGIQQQEGLITKLKHEIVKSIDDLTKTFEKVWVELKREDCLDQLRIMRKMSNVALTAEQHKEQILRRMKYIAAEREDRLTEKIDASKDSLTNLILSRRTANKCYGKVDVSGLLTADERLFPVMYDFSLIPGFETDSDFGGGWILFQRRFDGSIDFNRSWSEYRDGFGDLVQGEFWLGLQKLYVLMRFCPQELLIVVELANGTALYGHIEEFAITNEWDGYRVKKIGRCKGTWCVKCLVSTKNSMFSAYDRDNDVDLRNCAAMHGGWWYYACGQESYFNGEYLSTGDDSGILFGYPPWNYTIRSTKMMIRRKITRESYWDLRD